MNARLPVAALAVALLVPVAAPAQDLFNTQPSPGRPHGPWYAALSGGYAIPQAVTIKDSGLNGDINLDGGYVFAAAVGYRWPKYLRTEFEVGYQANAYDSATVNGVRQGMTGDVGYLTYAVNAFHDFDTGSSFVPYLGGGVGGVHKMNDSVTVNGVRIKDRGSENLELHGEIGLGIDLGREVTVGPAYRFTHVFDADQSFGDTTIHQIRMGLRVPFR